MCIVNKSVAKISMVSPAQSCNKQVCEKLRALNHSGFDMGLPRVLCKV